MAESDLKHTATEQHGGHHGTTVPDADSHGGRTHRPEDKPGDGKHGHSKESKEGKKRAAAKERTAAKMSKYSALALVALALSLIFAMGLTGKSKVIATELPDYTIKSDGLKLNGAWNSKVNLDKEGGVWNSRLKVSEVKFLKLSRIWLKDEQLSLDATKILVAKSEWLNLKGSKNVKNLNLKNDDIKV